MNSDFVAAMRQAVQLTRQRQLMEATRVIQRALSGWGRASPSNDPSSESARVIALANASDAAGAAEPLPHNANLQSARAGNIRAEERPSGRTRRPLGEVLDLLRQADRLGVGPHSAPLAKLRKTPPVPVPEGAAWLTRTFACEAGSRDYKVYVPSRGDGRVLPLVVMLHGCTQNPDDFAVGTGMNRLAEDLGFIVAYPRQPATANPSACWNWFNLADQRRDAGEPSIIAGITRATTAAFRIDAGRVYVAGLSAGGAMAAIMGAAYPELYAAMGIHSGLAYGSATDVASAFAAMRGGSSPIQLTPMQAPQTRRANGANGRVRTIVFHGASDKTVDPSNAEAILAGARAGLSDSAHETQQDGIAGGRAYTRTVITDASGAPQAECWEIDGLGHAWSGGSPEGSYTDPRGPDASREMLRFFLATGTEPAS